MGTCAERQAILSEVTLEVIAGLIVITESFDAPHIKPKLVPQTGVWPC